MRLLGIAGVPPAHCRDWVQCALGSDATESFLNSVSMFAGEKSAQRSINNQRARLKSILPQCNASLHRGNQKKLKKREKRAKPGNENRAQLALQSEMNFVLLKKVFRSNIILCCGVVFPWFNSSWNSASISSCRALQNEFLQRELIAI